MGHMQGVLRDLYPQKLPKLDLATDAEYVANLLNVSVWL